MARGDVLVVNNTKNCTALSLGCGYPTPLHPDSLKAFQQKAQLSDADAKALGDTVQQELAGQKWASRLSLLLFLSELGVELASDELAKELKTALNVTAWCVVLLWLAAWGMRLRAFHNIVRKLTEHFKGSRPDLSFAIRSTLTVNCIPLSWNLIVGYQTTRTAMLATSSQRMDLEKGENDREEPLLFECTD